MSDTVLIVLIIAITVLVVLIIFRRQLSRFLFKANREGIEAELETHKPAAPKGLTTPSPNQPGDRPSTTISGNWQIGSGNMIHVDRGDVAVEDNVQLGSDQEIKVRPDKTPPKQP